MSNTSSASGLGSFVEGSGRGAGHSPESRRFRNSKLEPSVVVGLNLRAAVLRATAAHRRDTSVVGECFDGAALRIECEINAAVCVC
jgi:hypothetical protein